MTKAPVRKDSSGPTGFVMPSESNPKTQGWAESAELNSGGAEGNDPFSAVASPPESSDGYGVGKVMPDVQVGGYKDRSGE
jgi:hypothetical protein